MFISGSNSESHTATCYHVSLFSFKLVAVSSPSLSVVNLRLLKNTEISCNLGLPGDRALLTASVYLLTDQVSTIYFSIDTCLWADTLRLCKYSISPQSSFIHFNNHQWSFSCLQQSLLRCSNDDYLFSSLFLHFFTGIILERGELPSPPIFTYSILFFHYGFNGSSVNHLPLLIILLFKLFQLWILGIQFDSCDLLTYPYPFLNIFLLLGITTGSLLML